MRRSHALGSPSQGAKRRPAWRSSYRDSGTNAAVFVYNSGVVSRTDNEHRRLTPEQVERLRTIFREKLKQPRSGRLVVPDPPPRYDEVYFEGVRWLDSLP